MTFHESINVRKWLRLKPYFSHLPLLEVEGPRHINKICIRNNKAYRVANSIANMLDALSVFSINNVHPIRLEFLQYTHETTNETTNNKTGRHNVEPSPH
jgi:hypothetical protein